MNFLEAIIAFDVFLVFDKLRLWFLIDVSFWSYLVDVEVFYHNSLSFV